MLTASCSLAADEADGVDVKQQAGSAAIRSGFGVEDMSAAEAQVIALEAAGVLVEQVTEVSRARVFAGNGEKHRFNPIRAMSSADDRAGPSTHTARHGLGVPGSSGGAGSQPRASSIMARMGAAWPGGVVFSQLDDEVNDNGDVGDQQGDPDQAVFLHDFVDFEWNERAGGEYDEVSGPVALEDEADALDQVQDGVKESACLDGAES